MAAVVFVSLSLAFEQGFSPGELAVQVSEDQTELILAFAFAIAVLPALSFDNLVLPEA